MGSPFPNTTVDPDTVVTRCEVKDKVVHWPFIHRCRNSASYYIDLRMADSLDTALFNGTKICSDHASIFKQEYPEPSIKVNLLPGHTKIELSKSEPNTVKVERGTKINEVPSN